MAKTTAARESVARYRTRMQRSGLRLVQLWLPDTRAPGFSIECRRQLRAAGKRRSAERDVMNWIEAGDDAAGWTA